MTCRPARSRRSTLRRTLIASVGSGLLFASASTASASGTGREGAGVSDATVPAVTVRDLDAVVKLRPTVRLAPGETLVRLRDVAWLEPEALAVLGHLTVGDLAVDGRTSRRGNDPRRTLRISPEDVRAVIADAGGHPARILVRGTVVTVNPGTERATAGRPVAMTAIRIDESGVATTGPGRRRALDDGTMDDGEASGFRYVAASLAMPGDDVLAAAAHRLLTRLAVRPDDLRIGFTEADRAWLARPMNTMQLRLLDPPDGTEVRLEMRPRPVPGSRQATEGGRIAVLRPQLRVQRMRLSEGVARGDRFEPAFIAAEFDWASPRAASLVLSRDEIVGLEAERRLEPGHLIGPSDIRRPNVIRRGESMIVRAGSRGFPMEITVIARENGRVGDRIIVRRPGDETEFPVLILAPGLGEPASPEPVRTSSRVGRR
jgi:flagella basal body P-ring formation protein FlgA